MMEDRKREVAVYCASGRDIDPLYFKAASKLGELLAGNGITCVNGAGKDGLMGALNDAVLLHNGKVKGIIPQFMVDNGWAHTHLTEMVITETIHQRKAAMVKSADAVIALPGGIGTLEELAEIITWKQLGLFRKSVIIINIQHFYQPLFSFLEKMINERFLNVNCRELWRVAATPEEAVDMILNDFSQDV